MLRTLLALALAATASAQGGAIGGLPTCAQSCIGTSIQQSGCQLIDYNCICSNQALISGLACCVGKVCSQSDIDTTLKFANNICANANPPVSIQQKATCASSAAAATSAPAASTGASSAAATSASVTAVSSGTSARASATSAAVSAAASATPTGAAGIARVELAAGLLGAGIAAGAFLL